MACWVGSVLPHATHVKVVRFGLPGENLFAADRDLPPDEPPEACPSTVVVVLLPMILEHMAATNERQSSSCQERLGVVDAAVLNS